MCCAPQNLMPVFKRFGCHSVYDETVRVSTLQSIATFLKILLILLTPHLRNFNNNNNNNNTLLTIKTYKDISDKNQRIKDLFNNENID